MDRNRIRAAALVRTDEMLYEQGRDSQGGYQHWIGVRAESYFNLILRCPRSYALYQQVSSEPTKQGNCRFQHRIDIKLKPCAGSSARR